MPGRRALITGIGGQDGSYLAELLLEKGYEVSGTVRGPVDAPRPNLAAVRGDVELLHGDLLVAGSLRAAVELAAPDELYHLAAPTFVPASWEDPRETIEAVAGSTATLLGLARRLGFRLYVAASSEVFGDAGQSPQRESTPMRPTSPYGVAKLAALGLVGVVRARAGVHASCGILYNHESPRRPPSFLPRKVTSGAAAIALGRQETLTLGDLGAVRDWSHAKDVVRAAWLMLQQEHPGDYVVASGRSHTVSDLVDAAFAAAGISAEGRVIVDPAFVRPTEATPPLGDPALARRRLGWTAEIGFEAMIAEMVEADLQALRA